MSASHARPRLEIRRGRRGPFRRSPLKEAPLRVAGQSLDEQITRLKADDLANWIGLTAGFGGLVASVWYQHFLSTPIQPWPMTLVGGLAVAFCVYHVRRVKRRIRQLELGRDGERIVAEALEALRQQGAVVFHDLQGAGFNIDHVIASRRGIVAVETKTRSKLPDSKVLYDGNSVRVDGLAPDRDPLVQALAEARALQQLLKQSTGKKYPVRPAVVFPGWWVESCNGAKGSPVWVLNEKALPAFVEHEPLVMSEEDFRLAAFHLSRLIRARNDH
jgi:hypothetical protein